MRRVIGTGFAALLTAIGLGVAAPAGASLDAGAHCDRVASPRGSDAKGTGTVRRPYLTANKLVASLSPGQTGCLRRGVYRSPARVTIRRQSVTLRSYPGERATLRGRLWILGDGAIVRGLNLDGSCPRPRRCDTPAATPSPLVNARNVVITGNDIQNRHTGICLSASSYRGISPDLLAIEGNRIHDCGRLPAKNHDHGIYLTAGLGAVIADNVVYDNADRGIQLYPSVLGARIYANTVDGNGEGVIVSNASSVNQFDSNIISDSAVRWNVDWNSLTGFANAITDNCLYATNRNAFYNRDGGVQTHDRQSVVLLNNRVANPGYANRARRDFRIAPWSPCAGRGAPDQVARP